MSQQISRFIIESHGPDIKALETAFSGILQLCLNKGISEITLLVPAKGNFPSTAIGKFLGEDFSKKLCKVDKKKLNNGIVLRLESERTFKQHKSYGLLFGIYLSRDGQNLLDSATNANAIAFLPWTEEEGKSWKETWNPTVIGKNTWQTPLNTLNLEVEQELTNLRDIINVSTGLLNPSDKKSAQNCFKRLKKGGYNPDPELIRRWALRDGWEPRHAESLKKLAYRYFS